MDTLTLLHLINSLTLGHHCSFVPCAILVFCNDETLHLMCYIKEKNITFLALGASELGVRGWDFTGLALAGVLLPAECMLLITLITKQHLQHFKVSTNLFLHYINFNYEPMSRIKDMHMNISV